MSIKLMSAVWQHAPVKGGQLLVLLALADHADDNGLCWPGVPSLAKKSRLTERQVQRILRKLEKQALVITEGESGPFGCNTYLVVSDRGDKMPPVTLVSLGGDAGVAGGVTPMSPKPSLESSIESSGTEEDTSSRTLAKLMKDRRRNGLPPTVLRALEAHER